MKISTSLSVAVATLALMGTVQAVPDPMASLSTCMSWAEDHKETDAFIPASKRCYSLKECNTNHSDNGEEFRDCSFQAEEIYRAEMEIIEGTGIEKVSAPAPTPVNMVTPVGTNPANSFYETDPDRKGYKESTQE
jgi:hypothetical protein